MRVRRRLPPVMQERDYALLWVALLVMAFATQMTAVAVGWQVYAIHRNPFDLGLIGLAEFLPLPLLALPAGQRRRPLPATAGASRCRSCVEIGVACLLLVVSLAGATQLWPFLALAAATGVAGALGAPAGRSIPPEVVSAELLPSAMALRSIAGQAAVIVGPAIGGVLFAVQPELVYATRGRAAAAGLGCMLALGARRLAVDASARASARPDCEAWPPASASSAGRPCCSARSRSISSPCSSAGPSRCCPSSRARSCTPGPPGSACCAAPPPSGRSSPGVSLARRPLRPERAGGRCSSSSGCSGRAWSSSGSRAGSRSRSSRWRSAASRT